MREVTQNYTVMVPYQEMRQGVRNIPVCEPATVAYTVCVDRGRWETREITVSCAPACGPGGYGPGPYGYGPGYGVGPYGYSRWTAPVSGPLVGRPVGYGLAGYGVRGTAFSGYGYGGYGYGINYGPRLAYSSTPVYVAPGTWVPSGGAVTNVNFTDAAPAATVASNATQPYTGTTVVPNGTTAPNGAAATNGTTAPNGAAMTNGSVAPGCGSCAPQMIKQCVQVWVPNIVREQRTCTVMRTRFVQQTYEYPVTLCRAETRTRTVQVCENVAEQVTNDVPVTICVPEKRTKTSDVTKYKCVTETQKQSYTVMVPTQEQRQVQVNVCKMVPQTIQQTIKVWVPNCAPAAQEQVPSDAPTPAPPGPPTNPATF
jgi:hypothetical protein